MYLARHFSSGARRAMGGYSTFLLEQGGTIVGCNTFLLDQGGTIGDCSNFFLEQRWDNRGL